MELDVGPVRRRVGGRGARRRAAHGRRRAGSSRSADLLHEHEVLFSPGARPRCREDEHMARSRRRSSASTRDRQAARGSATSDSRITTTARPGAPSARPPSGTTDVTRRCTRYTAHDQRSWRAMAAHVGDRTQHEGLRRPDAGCHRTRGRARPPPAADTSEMTMATPAACGEVVASQGDRAEHPSVSAARRCAPRHGATRARPVSWLRGDASSSAPATTSTSRWRSSTCCAPDHRTPATAAGWPMARTIATTVTRIGTVWDERSSPQTVAVEPRPPRPAR